MKTFLVCIAFLLVGSASANAQLVTKTGTTAAKFLSIPVGARALGMGGAFVAVANDASAMYWNPAGISRVRRIEVLVSHSPWLADIDFNYGGVVVPAGDGGSFGVNFTSLSMGEMERTTETQPDGTGEFFSAGSFAFGVSYARNLTDWFSIGANVKYVSEHIWNSTATGLAVDIGTLFNTPFQGLKFAAGVSNFGQKLQMSGDDLLVQKDISPNAGNNPNINAGLTTERFDMPLNLRIGFAYDVFSSESQVLTVVLDASHPNDNSESLSIGGEYTGFERMLSLRAGYRNLGMREGEEEFTVGGGLRYDVVEGTTLRVDYAFQQFGRLQNVHKFTFGVLF